MCFRWAASRHRSHFQPKWERKVQCWSRSEAKRDVLDTAPWGIWIKWTVESAIINSYPSHSSSLFCRFSLGDEVAVEINGARRMLHARIHSAGHLLDTAFSNIGVTDLEPSKVCMCLINMEAQGTGLVLVHRWSGRKRALIATVCLTCCFWLVAFDMNVGGNLAVSTAPVN